MDDRQKYSITNLDKVLLRRRDEKAINPRCPSRSPHQAYGPRLACPKVHQAQPSISYIPPDTKISRMGQPKPREWRAKHLSSILQKRESKHDQKTVRQGFLPAGAYNSRGLARGGFQDRSSCHNGYENQQCTELYCRGFGKPFRAERSHQGA